MSKNRITTVLFGWLLLSWLGLGGSVSGAPSTDEEWQLPDLTQRAFIASSIYAAIPQHFAHWQDTGELDLESAYRKYLAAALGAATRREFSLATQAFLAQLKNGHTRFSDRALNSNAGLPLDFSAHYIDGQWVVVDSDRLDLLAGDVIQQIDGQGVEDFFRQQLPFLSHSTERWAPRALLGQGSGFVRFLLPLQFSLTLTDGRLVEVDRRGEHEPMEKQTTGRWLVPERFAYLEIPAFSPRRFEQRAIELVEEFSAAEGLVIDLRGNSGGNTPVDLSRQLFDRRFPWWRESTPVKFGSFGLEGAELTWKPWWNEPGESSYQGAVILLIDAGCFSACEDFAMPFKVTGRATLIGEATGGSSGQPHFIRFGDGMVALIGSKREHFPNGDQFESIGIVPDIELQPTIEQIRQGFDPLIERALTELRSVDTGGD